jgi:hypothetical protein
VNCAAGNYGTNKPDFNGRPIPAGTTDFQAVCCNRVSSMQALLPQVMLVASSAHNIRLVLGWLLAYTADVTRSQHSGNGCWQS